MKNNVLSFIAGIIFSLGLGVSGMTNPAKIIGFLDVFGAWDPTMIFVVGGAILTFGISWRFIKKRPLPLWDKKFFVPTNTVIDKPLVIGSSIFGVGWGLSGYCPGPAIVSIPGGETAVFIYMAAMISGMYAFKVYQTVAK